MGKWTAGFGLDWATDSADGRETCMCMFVSVCVCWCDFCQPYPLPCLPCSSTHSTYVLLSSFLLSSTLLFPLHLSFYPSLLCLLLLSLYSPLLYPSLLTSPLLLPSSPRPSSSLLYPPLLSSTLLSSPLRSSPFH